MASVSRSLIVTAEGVSYNGELMRITSTRLGWEDHGILTVSLGLEGVGTGVSAGGFCLDQPIKPRPEHKEFSRRGTAYGLDHVMRIIWTVGAEKWEDLPGLQVVALYGGDADGKGNWGRQCIGIAGALNDRVLIFKDHANVWLEAEKASA